MRYLALVLCSVFAGVAALAYEGPAQQAPSQGNVANPNVTDCEDLATRAENLAVQLEDTYGRYQNGNDVTADLGQILTDLKDIATDIGPCTGQAAAIGGQDQQQGQQEQQSQQ